jgi:ribosomal protein S18 acetylase RimI-like enzyme
MLPRVIRPASPPDLPALARALAGLPLLARYGSTAARLEAVLAVALARGERLRLAEEGGAPAGLVWFQPSGTLALGGYLRLIAVVDGAQRRGTGAALLAAFEEETAQESAHAFLLVSDFNAGAQRFYARHGYRRVGELPGLVLPEVGELLYWKRLR